jgi:hypothetical protein
MNNYFSLSSTNNNHIVQPTYETDYNRGNFRLTNTTDPSFMNMMQTATSNFEQYQSTNEYYLPTSNGTMSVTNPMFYYTHPWMRPGININSLR